MRAYQFRLEAVLTLREQIEQAAQTQCARAYLAVEQAGARVHSVQLAIDAAEEVQRQQFSAQPRADQVKQLLLYLGSLRQKRLQLVRALAEARQSAEAAQRTLLAATQQREALQRLRNRQQRAHDYESARAEQRVLDDRPSRLPGLSQAANPTPAGL